MVLRHPGQPDRRIWAGELSRAVRFAAADPALAEEIDAAYTATVRIEPR
jgi:hypothetical protein